MSSFQKSSVKQFASQQFRLGSRQTAEEMPIAVSYGGSTHAVMMGTPADLEDFAIGFSLTEGIISSTREISSIDVVEVDDGIDVQVQLADDMVEALRSRRRSMAGPVGCGLCGIESIEQALRPIASVAEVGLTLTPGDVAQAVSALNEGQLLNRVTRSVHGAGFYVPGSGISFVREDVGRHNALDKLGGAIHRAATFEAADGAIVVTSRLSVEMVQKAATFGVGVLIAVSAPTALAIRCAEDAGMTLVAIARGDEFEIFSHDWRVIGSEARDVQKPHSAAPKANPTF